MLVLLYRALSAMKRELTMLTFYRTRKEVSDEEEEVVVAVHGAVRCVFCTLKSL